MWKKLTALVLVVAFPATASAGPLTAAAEKAALELARVQAVQEAPRGNRFWTGVALIAGGGLMAVLGAMEVVDDESGPDDDDEDMDASDDGEDSDSWANGALLGGGITAAALGGVLVWTGRNNASVSVRPHSVTVRHTIRF